MKSSLRVVAFLIAVLINHLAPAAEPSTREQKVRADRAKVEAEGFWIYNDMDKAYATARETGKPILVSMRCLPCEECVKLDDDLIENDPVVRPLLEKFVCVRVVGTNGLDLDTFQYDTDQSFAIFMLNADKTIYGRFGTRSHRTDWLGDVSIEGMAEALKASLALHSRYPSNQEQLAAKRGAALEFSSPEQYPSLNEKYTDRLNYEGDVVKSCIHCHQIGDARREFYWSRSEPIPEKLLFPYPHPKSIGLVLDPTKRATIKSVTEGTPAAASRLQPGDDLLSMNGQPLVSMADVQWVLHNLNSEPQEVELLLRRDGAITKSSLSLPSEWRRLDDPRWRVSSWGMSRMMTGGMRLQALTDEERAERGIVDGMALRASSVGKYGPHATAMKAGFLVDDIVVSYDGRTDLMREADLFAYANANRRPGDKVAVEILRGRDKKTLSMPIQK
ncbi:Trx7/PDZ domain-containing (seleno)protein [Stieleria varia]|uniref:PDZ domain (Also known as DHR or GLGF) n=1 Tax=Stieleria varia TaxID=2528005 RepID=A0A5C6ATP9_9BACT|nr:Trx7/PDZ domain-containing (seleno)protein [Stieleria varia]TWU02958.1 PDZ domain (Also known as DHR or GLGF) [Stieleria varia]